MQNLSEIRSMLQDAGLAPRRRFGQNFLIDGNLMSILLARADVAPGQTVLEVGPGTGSLTEELLDRGARVVAVEIDRGLADVLDRRLGGREGFTLIRGDVLACKHALSPAVRAAVGRQASLVSNLPYSIATPLVALCLTEAWRARSAGAAACLFDSLTFTVQKEVADRLVAGPCCQAYGPVSVHVALLGRTTLGPMVPASAFWPRPNVASRIVRIDFDAGRAAAVENIDMLRAVVSLAFAQRRKQIGSMVRRKGSPPAGDALRRALADCGIDPRIRPEQMEPEAFAKLASSARIAGG